ncbi:hypothetical protein [Mitsuaria sp. GD03876]|uniref:hypothetical protein n=1 Tax=Mitsuaria sp. GD03876 TaxID=2975399 RepID=UPI00244B7143|nr:hypothetical protein [Mitsuaria sp. GD03876]MDH0867457.1 hypothetical protein [Mitsuaria sp. GD03876]
MNNFDIQFGLNSVTFVVIMVSHADRFASRAGRLSLIGFLAVVFASNAVLNLDRFAPWEAIVRGAGNAAVVAVCTLALARYNEWRRMKKASAAPRGATSATAADTPAAPPGPAP